MTTAIAGPLLAASTGSRLGRPKALVEARGVRPVGSRGLGSWTGERYPTYHSR
jgi:hypothetical protein